MRKFDTDGEICNNKFWVIVITNDGCWIPEGLESVGVPYDVCTSMGVSWRRDRQVASVGVRFGMVHDAADKPDLCGALTDDHSRSEQSLRMATDQALKTGRDLLDDDCGIR